MFDQNPLVVVIRNPSYQPCKGEVVGNNLIYISYETLVTKLSRGRTSLPFVKLSFTVYANENKICSFPDLSKAESHCCMLQMTHFKVHMHPSRKHEQGRGVGFSNPSLLFPFYLHIILIEHHTPNYHFFQRQTSGLAWVGRKYP